MHRVASLIIGSAVAITSVQAQTATELRISGTVEKLDGNLLALSLSQGISIVVRLNSEPRVNTVAKGSESDLKAGSQVGIQAKNGQSGDLIATQIVLFAPGSNRPDAEPGPDNAQLVGTNHRAGCCDLDCTGSTYRRIEHVGTVRHLEDAFAPDDIWIRYNNLAIEAAALHEPERAEKTRCVGNGDAVDVVRAQALCSHSGATLR